MLDKFGVDAVVSPEKVVFVTDHEPLTTTPEAAIRQKKVRDYAKKYRIGQFFDVGRGGHGHVFPVELGLVRPGGLGSPDLVSWGRMLNSGQQFMSNAWWLSVFPGMAILCSVLAFNLLGDAISRALNPRTRGR